MTKELEYQAEMIKNCQYLTNAVNINDEAMTMFYISKIELLVCTRTCDMNVERVIQSIK